MNSILRGRRVVLSTFGSFGDVHPYISIALELKARGASPLIATSEIYREKTDALGLELHPVRPTMPSYDRPDEIIKMLEDFMDPRTGTERIISTLITPYLREAYEDLTAAVAGADLLLTHPLPFVGPMVAAKTGVKWVSSVLAPASFFSVYDPPVPPPWPGLYSLMKLHPLFARVVFRLAKWKVAALAGTVNNFRAEVGLPPGGHPFLEGQHSPQRVLALFSRVLARPQADWPPQTRITGFPFYDRRDRPGDTAGGAEPWFFEFLDAGPPPVVFTLGSAAFWVAKDFYRVSIEAARMLGQRALLLIGDARNLPADPLPESVAAVEYAPFSEVLRRASVVVHHGGVGSTGQSLKSGRPMLVVPFSHDQFDNGGRIARLGAGRMLPRRAYTARRVAGELKRLLHEPHYAAQAEAAGRVVEREDGARAACDEMEKVLRNE